MKIVDVDLFQDGLQRNMTMLDRLSGEMEAIHHAVEGLVQMEEQLKGAGGNAIRSFYQECHLPFLHFFQLFSEQFEQVLHRMEAALHSLEPDSNGYILEQFLDGELEQGLTLIGHLTASLTDEANSILDQVSDIVGLPHLDDSGVQEGVIRSKRKRDDTLTQLYEFDASQTTALNPIEQDLQTMNTWLSDMEGLFQAGVKDINFLPSGWDVLTFRSNIRTELFPKVYLNPNDLWVKEHEQLIGTMITAATFQTLEEKKVKTIEENVEENIKYHEYENGLLIKEYVVGQTVFFEVVSKVEYKEEAVQADKMKGSNGLDHFQTGLDIAGLIPGFGEIADGVNGLIYSARGDATNAALSFGAMIPFVGWASTGGKFVKKGSDLYQVRNVVSTEKIESIYSPIYKDVVNSPLGKTQNQLDLISNTHYQLGTTNFLTCNMPSAKMEIPTSIKSGIVNVKTEINNVDVGAKGSGKIISIKDYEAINKAATYNPDSTQVMLGKFDGGGSTNYITKAGEDYNYFSLGNDWNKIKGQQNLTDHDMFKLFNEPFLDDAVNSGKSINFSHDPRIYSDSALGMEWKYLQDNYGLTRLVENGGLWIAK